MESENAFSKETADQPVDADEGEKIQYRSQTIAASDRFPLKKPKLSRLQAEGGAHGTHRTHGK
jgi:hypothetical protein